MASEQKPAVSLEFREATKVYPGAAEAAVDKLSLTVPAGEICVFVGPSGCGKTTAMRMVNRLIDITDGDILIDGASVRERKPAELRREIGYAIQQIGLFPHRTVGDNIGTVPKLLGRDKAWIRRRAAELLELRAVAPGEPPARTFRGVMGQMLRRQRAREPRGAQDEQVEFALVGHACIKAATRPRRGSRARLDRPAIGNKPYDVAPSRSAL